MLVKLSFTQLASNVCCVRLFSNCELAATLISQLPSGECTFRRSGRFYPRLYTMALLASRNPVRGSNFARHEPGACNAKATRKYVTIPLRCVSAAAQKQQYSSFEDLLCRSEVPVLVDFYATWCGPCQMMSPTLSSIASKFKGRLQVVKIDTDRNPSVASQHKVQALPTIALFVGGKQVFRFEGVMTEPQLTERLNYLMGQANAQ